jgi:ornithine cyclodeaminase/alanine dehydrogenase-like protein (mu-crystallin family)
LREILVLGETDVEELLDPAGCRAAVERALVAVTRSEVHVPLRTIVRPPGDETLIGLMPTHRGGDARMYGLKTVVVVPGNSTRGLDPHQGTVTLFDGETGQTVAVVNATPITAIRTAAASALATGELAREDAHVLAIVGAGFQAKAHLRALAEVREFDDVRIASRTHAKADALAEEHPAAKATESIEEAIRGADVIATVTSSAEPVIDRAWIADGTHINAVGACFPHTRELDSATVQDSTLVVDSRESAVNESGDYLIALAEGAIGEEHIVAELGDVLVGTHPGRTSPEEITVFDSLGIAVEDLFAAEYVVARARETGRGQRVQL